MNLKSQDKIWCVTKLVIRRIEFRVMIGLVILYGFYMLNSGDHDLSNELDSKIKTDFIGFSMELMTLMVVCSVWLFEVKREWEESLNKFLSVVFIDPLGNMQIKCFFAPLSIESDMRALAQALGKSANGNENLPLEQMLNRIQKNIVKDTAYAINDGEPFMSYQVEMKLTATLTKILRNKADPLELPVNHYLDWSYPFGSITLDNIKPHQA